MEAVVPAVEAAPSYQYWSFASSNCGHNRSAPRAATWTAADADCLSADGMWQNSCHSCPSSSPTAPAGVDTGNWTVTLGDPSAPALTSPYVDVPLEVDIADWGDASHLVITATATEMTPVWYYNSPTDYGWTASWSGGDTTTVTVPRRSGPPPSDDALEVNIAEISALPSVTSSRYDPSTGTTTHYVDNDRFVDVLRSTLLANDACPVGTDCTDPLLWPLEVARAGGGCPADPFASHYPTERHTRQGAVGCDDLNETGDPLDPASVQYWPRLWATGADTFQYSTYGGRATVTVQFTDQPPAAPDVVVVDPGTQHTVATFGSPAERSVRYCYSWNSYYNTCRQYKWRYYVDHSWADTDWSATHHTGRVSLAAVRDGDPDNDTDSVEIADGNNPHLSGQSGTIGDAGDYSHWETDATEEWTYTGVCYPTCPTAAQRFASFVRDDLQQPVNTVDGTQATNVRECVQTATSSITTDITVYGYGTAPNSTRYYVNEFSRWSAAAATDPACVTSVPDECGDSTMLEAWSMCYALWPNTADPAPLVVDYRACDARNDAALTDRGAFGDYLLPLISPAILASHPRLTEADVDSMISRRLAGHDTRPSYWGPPLYITTYPFTEDEWDAVVAATDAALHDRYCADGTVTVVLGDVATVSLQPAASSAAEGTPLTFDVVLDASAVVDVTVDLSVGPDTAGTDPAEPSDYDLASDPGCRAVVLPVTIPAGQDRATVQVCTVQDSIHENDETLRVSITGADLATLGTTVEAVGTILNDDPLPELSIGDASVDEDASIPLNPPIDINGDGTLDSEHIVGETLRFTVTLTGESDLTITVSYDTEASPGTATSVTSCQAYPGSAAEDYEPRSSSLTFSPGDTSKTFTVTLCPDDQHEGNETIIVTLSGPTNAALSTATATGTGTGTIVDNDSLIAQCQALHGPGWAPVLYPDGTPWVDSSNQIVCAMPH